jgi:hypothetical protein
MEACALAGLIQELIASIAVTAVALSGRRAAVGPARGSSPGEGVPAEGQQQGGHY